MITKENYVEITIDRYGYILQKTITQIIEDGNILTETNHRTSYEPGADLKDAHQRVKDHAAVAWTSEILAKYAEKKAKIDT